MERARKGMPTTRFSGNGVPGRVICPERGWGAAAVGTWTGLHPARAPAPHPSGGPTLDRVGMPIPWGSVQPGPPLDLRRKWVLEVWVLRSSEVPGNAPERPTRHCHSLGNGARRIRRQIPVESPRTLARIRHVDPSRACRGDRLAAADGRLAPTAVGVASSTGCQRMARTWVRRTTVSTGSSTPVPGTAPSGPAAAPAATLLRGPAPRVPSSASSAKERKPSTCWVPWPSTPRSPASRSESGQILGGRHPPPQRNSRVAPPPGRRDSKRPPTHRCMRAPGGRAPGDRQGAGCGGPESPHVRPGPVRNCRRGAAITTASKVP